MPGNVRIEKCANEQAALRRKTALMAEGFSVRVALASAYAVTIDVNADGTLPMAPAITVVDAPWVVLAVREI